MKSKVVKWGNSLGLRIPKAYVEELNIVENIEIDISVQEEKLVVVVEDTTLEDLLMQVTEENRHQEYDIGTSKGKEIW